MADVARVVLVTGASRGIGRAIASKLAEDGYALAVQATERGAAELRIAAEQWRARVPVLELVHDFASDPAPLVDRVVDELGGIWGLVNNAGVLSTSPFWETDGAELERVFRINTFAPFLLGSRVFRQLETQGRGGRIVNISSCSVRFGMGRNRSIQYAASKAALEALTTGLSRSGAAAQILVNTVRPGVIATELQADRPGLAERVDLIPVKRVGQPGEIAEMVAFLMSDRAAFITGETISVSGGE